MKIRWIAGLLLLTMLLGTLSCTAVTPTAGEHGDSDENPNFISGAQRGLLDTEERSTKNLLNVAVTDKEIEALFHHSPDREELLPIFEGIGWREIIKRK